MGNGGLFLWKCSYALHTVVIPSSCGIFLYRLVTSIVTMKVHFRIFVFSMKLIKSVESLRWNAYDVEIGWSNVSTNGANLSVGRRQPEITGLLLEKVCGCLWEYKIWVFVVDSVFGKITLESCHQYGCYGWILRSSMTLWCVFLSLWACQEICSYLVVIHWFGCGPPVFYHFHP